MPEESYRWLPRTALLSFEEIERIVRVFTTLGVRRVRLTGGEPLLRKDLPALVARLTQLAALEEVTLTTNAVHLARQAEELFAAGLTRITVSLDSLRRERFRAMTQRDELERVFEGLAAARTAGFSGTKLNAVVMRGENDDELGDLVAFGRDEGLEVRFIEYMDVAGATRWTSSKVVPREEILARVSERFGALEEIATPDAAPARRFRLPDGTRFGVIASTTAPFCASCDRARMTADGTLFTCLYATRGRDVRELLRSGIDDAALHAALTGAWRERDDQGAVERAAEGPARQGDWVPREDLRERPQIEMHTKGG